MNFISLNLKIYAFLTWNIWFHSNAVLGVCFLVSVDVYNFSFPVGLRLSFGSGSEIGKGHWLKKNSDNQVDCT